MDENDLDSPTARTLRVLEWFSEHPGHTIAELSRAIALTKTSAHRIVAELVRLGWLSRAPGHKGPVIGPRGLDMAASSLQNRVEDVASTLLLQRLADELGESCTLAVRDGFDVRFVAHVPPRGLVAYVVPNKDHAPLFCSSSGRVFLAEWPRQAVDQYLERSERRAFTEHTVVEAQRLRGIIDEARRNGYASACQQWVINVIGAAVPIRDKRGRCVATLSFNAPDNRVTTADVPRFIPALQIAAKELGHLLYAEAK
jgi:DNA-binding IclR family transcriptional regulator